MPPCLSSQTLPFFKVQATTELPCEVFLVWPRGVRLLPVSGIIDLVFLVHRSAPACRLLLICLLSHLHFRGCYFVTKDHLHVNMKLGWEVDNMKTLDANVSLLQSLMQEVPPPHLMSLSNNKDWLEFNLTTNQTKQPPPPVAKAGRAGTHLQSQHVGGCGKRAAWATEWDPLITASITWPEGTVTRGSLGSW